MKYFKDSLDNIFAFEDDGSQDEYISVWLTQITQNDAKIILANKNLSFGVPQIVSRFQGRAALANAGHFTTVNNYMASLPVDNLQRLAWEDAQEFRRNSPTVAAMQALLGLSDTEIDDLFIEAATIEV